MNRPILIVEDDRKISKTIKLYLEHAGYDVLSAFDGQAALIQARDEKPILIILDLMLPHLDGLEVCRLLCAENSEVYIIMLTAKSTEVDKLRGLGLGADDYLTKPFSPRELMARVKAVLRRQRDNPNDIEEPVDLRIKDLVIDFRQHQVLLDGRQVSLTPKEFCLLTVLAKSPNRVFTRSELIERAFGNDYDGLDRTLDVHIKNLRRKINSNLLQSSKIETVYGIGYKFLIENDVS